MHLFVSFILKAGMWVAMDVVSYDWLGPGYSGVSIPAGTRLQRVKYPGWDPATVG